MMLVSLGACTDHPLQKDASKKSAGLGSARPGQLRASIDTPMAISPRVLAGSTSPNFRWTAINGATQYTLKLRNPSGLITLKTVDANDVIMGSKCMWTWDLPPLTAGSYVWWVRAHSGTNVGDYSAPASFRITEQPPARTTPISPSGLTSAKLPLFTWSAAPGATSYTIQVDNADSEDGEILNLVDIPADEVTQGSRCSLRSPMPLSGVLFWRVQAHNDFGDGTISGYRYFETVCGCKSGLALAKARQAQPAVKKCEACSRKG